MKFIKNFMGKSIRNRLAVTFIGMMALFLVVIILINTFFLERVYTISREQCFFETYDMINDVKNYSSLASNRDFIDYLLENNLSLIILDEDASLIVSFAKDAEDMRDRLIFGLRLNLEGEQQILRSSQNYILERRVNTPSITDSINMYGNLDNGDEFLITFAGKTEQEADELIKLVEERLLAVRRQDRIPYELSFCTGILELKPEHTMSVTDILREVDERMYDQKRQYHMRQGKESVLAASEA